MVETQEGKGCKWTCTTTKVYVNNNPNEYNNGLKFQDKTGNELIIQGYVTLSRYKINELFIRLSTNDDSLNNKETEFLFDLDIAKNINNCINNKDIEPIINKLFINNYVDVERYFEKRLDKFEMNEIIISMYKSLYNNSDTKEEVNSDIFISLDKMNIYPLEVNELNNVLKINTVDANIDKTYLISCVNGKYILISQQKHGEGICNDICTFSTLDELSKKISDTLLDKGHKEFVEKLFMKNDETLIDNQHVIEEVLDGATDLNYKIKLMDYINNIQGKKYDYDVVLGFYSDEAECTQVDIPKRRAINIDVKNTYRNNRKNLNEHYSAFNKSPSVASYSIYKTDLNRENEVTIKGTRNISVNNAESKQLVDILFYDIKEHRITKGANTLNVLNPLKPLLNSIFNKDNYKDFDSLLTFSKDTSQDKVMELRLFIVKNNSNKTWV